MSSAELTATEEADMADCDGDKVVTMMDVLQEQEDFEEDANAVLGASDEKNCTYSKGYIKRQALYACLTCCPDAKTDPTKRAGVCLACSLSCHENHELVELYTKRNFCCDCGNPKFNSHPCQFTSNKPNLNENNSYNQNFSGLYCVCHRPYPDPESTVEDEMIQCVICEDWLHATHLEAKVPPNEQYSEMICKGCMEKNEFLLDYSDFAVNDESDDVDVTTETEKVNGVCNGDSKTHDLKSDIKENGDVDMADVQENGSSKDNKTAETAIESSNDPSENTEKAAAASMEAGQNEQNAMENEPAEQNDSSEKVPEATQYDKDSTVTSETEKEICDSKEKDIYMAIDTNIEANAEEPSVSPSTEKPEEQLAESEEKTSTDEQNIANDNLENKTDDTHSDEKAEPTTTDGETVEPESAPKEPTQGAENTTVETETKRDEVTLDSEKDSTEKIGQPENKQEENMEKDDLMESIDRLINGDDDIPSEQDKEKVETVSDQEKASVDETTKEKVETVSDQEKTSVDETTKEKVETVSDQENTSIDETTKNIEEKISEESMEKIDEPTESEDAALNGDKSDEKEDTDVDMESTVSKDDNTNSTNNDKDVEPSNENKRKLDEDTADKADVKKPKLDDAKPCIRPKRVKRHIKGATFWPHNFRQKLCTCNECITMYKDLSVLFLIDLEDTVSAYELLGKEKNDGRSSQYEIGLQALSSLDRIQQINALTEYNKMRDKLLDFLKSFKDRKEVVKEEDIKAFFAGMKPKREPDGVYFCR